jgi:hypothetical protein
MDRSFALRNRSLWILSRTTKMLLNQVNPFHKNLLATRQHLKNLALLTGMISGNHLDLVTL